MKQRIKNFMDNASPLSFALTVLCLCYVVVFVIALVANLLGWV